MDSLVTTYQTRISKDQDSTVGAALDAVSEVWNHAYRSYVRQVSSGNAPSLNVMKSSYIKDFGINARYFNSIRSVADGVIDAAKSNAKRYLKDKKKKLAKLKAKEVRLAEQVATKGVVKSNKKQRINLHRCRTSVAKLTKEIRKLEYDIKHRVAHICLGSDTLFAAQHNLDANGYASHDEWRSDWREARTANFTLVGSKDETAGNQICQISINASGTFDLKVRVPVDLEETYGKYIEINDLQFEYGHSAIIAAIIENDTRRKESSWLTKGYKHVPSFLLPKESKHLENYGQALTYKFVRDHKGWRICVTLEESALPDITTNKLNGAIGVDLNEHHVSVAALTHNGNLDFAGDVYFGSDKYNTTSKQNLTAIAEAVKQIVDEAIVRQAPIVIEDLDFASKKQNLDKGGALHQKKYNRMLTQFASATFRQLITRRAARHGVEVIIVNPAYTSLIGKLKYANQVNYNTHQSAAMVIGRRGIGYADSIPSQVSVLVGNTVQKRCIPVDMLDSMKDVAKLASTWHSGASVRSASLPSRADVIVSNADRDQDPIPF